MKFLIDECLSPELVKLAHEYGYGESSHVVWMGLAGHRRRVAAIRMSRSTIRFGLACALHRMPIGHPHSARPLALGASHALPGAAMPVRPRRAAVTVGASPSRAFEDRARAAAALALACLG